jgi:hypothetical protein
MQPDFFFPGIAENGVESITLRPLRIVAIISVAGILDIAALLFLGDKVFLSHESLTTKFAFTYLEDRSV